MRLPRWVYALIAFVIFSIVAIVIFRFLTPGREEFPVTPLMTTNITGTQTSFQGIIYTGPNANPPAQLSLAQGTPLNRSLEDVLNKLVSDNSLQQIEGTQIWKSETASVNVDEYSSLVQFVKPTAESGVVSEKEAIAAAIEFYQAIYPNLTLTPIESEIEFTSGDAHLSKVDKKTATYMIIPLASTINTYPVFFKNSSNLPFQAIVDGNNQVVQASFFPQTVSLSPTQTHRTISINEAIENINNDKGTIISAYSEVAEAPTLDQIISGELKSFSIEYRYDDSLNLAYPYYRFKGTLMNKNGTALESEVITPAIPLQ
jgi:hypothetical protein